MLQLLGAQPGAAVAELFDASPRVDFGIDAALERQMGEILTDSPEEPSVAVVRQGPFRYVAGDPASPAAQLAIGALAPSCLLMPSADGWLERIQSVFEDRISPCPRFRFRANALSRHELRAIVENSSHRPNSHPIDLNLADRLWHEPGNLAEFDGFRSPRDFVERGLGYCVIERNRVIAVASSSLVCRQGAEVSIYVEQRYRRRGLATLLGALMADACLARHLEPHWDAANRESCGLARKLGYVEAGTYTAYYLQQQPAA